MNAKAAMTAFRANMDNEIPLITEAAMDVGNRINLGETPPEEEVPSRKEVTTFCQTAIDAGCREMIESAVPDLVELVSGPLSRIEGDLVGWDDARPTVEFISTLANQVNVGSEQMLLIERNLDSTTFLTHPEDYLAHMEAIDLFCRDESLVTRDLESLHRRMTSLSQLGLAVDLDSIESETPNNPWLEQSMKRLRSFETHHGLSPFAGSFLTSRHEARVENDTLFQLINPGSNFGQVDLSVSA